MRKARNIIAALLFGTLMLAHAGEKDDEKDKAAEAAAKASEKQDKKDQETAEKAEKEAEKAAEKAEKDAEKAAEKAEKEAEKAEESPEKEKKIKLPASKPLPDVKNNWPATPSGGSAVPAPSIPLSNLFKRPVKMKLLLLSVDGTEPGFAALKFFLDYLGLPYDAVLLKPATTVLPLPALTDATNTGLYQGIILATGGLGYSAGGAWLSAIDADGWLKIDKYMLDYGVRLASYYTFPESRYGMSAITGLMTSAAAPAKLAFTSAAATVFPYLVRTNPLKIEEAYVYLAAANPAAGETTVPILTVNNQVAGVVHTKADGRELMAFTFDNNPYLTHSLALNYGLFNWVTKGLFLGERRIYLTAQNDDFFLPNDLFATKPPECMPPGFVTDPTFDPGVSCPNARMTGADLKALDEWQSSWRAKAQTKDFRVAHAFNGFGTTEEGGGGKNDSLLKETRSRMNSFFWVNHTWDHENLDCFEPVAGSGICRPATLAQSIDELGKNIVFARSIGLPIDQTSVVTPNISGLTNRAFLQTAALSGVKYLVSDASRPIWMPSAPNTGVRSPYVNSILYIPRRATSLFYNTMSGEENAYGSLPDEYNYFYGPAGIFRIGGGSSGAPFFNTKQTYAQIIDRESDTYLGYMLRYEVYPLMFHQSNFIRYSGNKTLFADVMNATLNKYVAITNLPVASLSQTAIGQKLEERMAYNAAQVEATYDPSGGVMKISAPKGAATVPVTGICAAGCTTYGNQNISFVRVSANGTVSIRLN